MKTSARHLLLTAALGLVTSLVPPLGPASASTSAAPAPTVQVSVGQLERGDDPRIPHVADGRVVDGRSSVPVRGVGPTLLGVSGDEYVVNVRRQGVYQAIAVRMDGIERRVATTRGPYNVTLSSDGSRLVRWSQTRQRTRVWVYDTADGALVGSRAVRGYGDVLDVDADQLLLARDVRRGTATLRWRFDDDRWEKALGARAYVASIEGDRIATFDRDPDEGGCSTVFRLSDLRQLSRSCRERVQSFSPDGRRMSTVDILSDGPGPGRVSVSRANGRVEARYTVARGYFAHRGTLDEWEDSSTLLLRAVGRRLQTDVRCGDADCERTGDLETTRGA